MHKVCVAPCLAPPWRAGGSWYFSTAGCVVCLLVVLRQIMCVKKRLSLTVEVESEVWRALRRIWGGCEHMNLTGTITWCSLKIICTVSTVHFNSTSISGRSYDNDWLTFLIVGSIKNNHVFVTLISCFCVFVCLCVSLSDVTNSWLFLRQINGKANQLESICLNIYAHVCINTHRCTHLAAERNWK